MFVSFSQLASTSELCRWIVDEKFGDTASSAVVSRLRTPIKPVRTRSR
jgi:hypothetical protein